MINICHKLDSFLKINRKIYCYSIICKLVGNVYLLQYVQKCECYFATYLIPNFLSITSRIKMLIQL